MFRDYGTPKLIITPFIRVRFCDSIAENCGSVSFPTISQKLCCETNYFEKSGFVIQVQTLLWVDPFLLYSAIKSFDKLTPMQGY